MSKKVARLIPAVRKMIDHINHLKSEQERLLADRRSILNDHSREADDVYFHYNSSFDVVGTICAFQLEDAKPAPQFLTNFLGARIETGCLPGILTGKEGIVEGLPIPSNWHADMAEWAFCLRAVETAKENFRIVELGCGWGCWLNNTGVAAKRRGLSVKLIGVDGAKNHVDLTLKCLTDNGFVPDEYQVLQGIAASKSGGALFPVYDGPSWLAAPVFDASEIEIDRACSSGEFELVNCYTLPQLAGGDLVDLLHIDIQGGEAEFVRANLSHMTQTVRRVFIGTHSRQIEAELMRLMEQEGWELEIERPCVFTLERGSQTLTSDGVQGWRNPSL